MKINNHTIGGIFLTVEVAVIMGSTSDWETMKPACEILDELAVDYEKKSYQLTGHQN